MRNSFYRGIESLSSGLQQKLLESINISFDPIYGTLGPNTSTVSYPLDDDLLERKLRLKYMFDKRNRFTHRLEQYFAASSPMAWPDKNGPSWRAVIEDSCLSYLSGNQEIQRLGTGGAYAYFAAWPFVLFETLHAAVGSTFHRTDIKLRFGLWLHHSSVPGRVITAEVSHDQLKDVHILEAQLLKLHAQGSVLSKAIIAL